MDNLSREQRSYCMSRIRSKWTGHEKKLHNHLKGRKIKHEMHPNIAGNPDIILTDFNKAIFIHGCFWHKCPKCWTAPKSNKKYWLPKIEKNVKRDKKNTKLLRKDDWEVERVWEHDLKNNFGAVFEKIIR